MMVPMLVSVYILLKSLPHHLGQLVVPIVPTHQRCMLQWQMRPKWKELASALTASALDSLGNISHTRPRA